MDEEDAEIAYRAAATISQLISCHVHKLENIQSFVDKQMDLLNYSTNKFAFKNVDLNKSEQPMTEEEIAKDYSTQNLIKRFKYMRDNGIIKQYLEADRKLFNNY